jgi:NADP-dependent 3-hydroxy acid dehydrogenase YdfG
VTALAKQWALVTGASGGIGAAIAGELARAGVNTIIVGRNRAKLDAVASNVSNGSQTAMAVTCDLTKVEDIDSLFDQVAAIDEQLDILVHCAGVVEHGPLAGAPLGSLDRQYQANVRGPLLLTQRLLPKLKSPRGQIVFINSSVGLKARANAGHFSATQHAFKALADALREEVNAAGIRVMNVFPGRTATPRIASLHELEGRPFQPEVLLQPEDIASVVVNALSLPWTAEVTDISIRPMLKSY